MDLVPEAYLREVQECALYRMIFKMKKTIAISFIFLSVSCSQEPKIYAFECDAIEPKWEENYRPDEGLVINTDLKTISFKDVIYEEEFTDKGDSISAIIFTKRNFFDEKITLNKFTGEMKISLHHNAGEPGSGDESPNFWTEYKCKKIEPLIK